MRWLEKRRLFTALRFPSFPMCCSTEKFPPGECQNNSLSIRKNFLSMYEKLFYDVKKLKEMPLYHVVSLKTNAGYINSSQVKASKHGLATVFCRKIDADALLTVKAQSCNIVCPEQPL